MPPTTYIDTVEAAYDLDAAPEAWLKRLTESAPYLDRGLGVMAWTFDAGRAVQEAVQITGGRPELKELPANYARIQPKGTSAVLGDARVVTTASESMAAHGFSFQQWQSLLPHGVEDFLAVKSICPSGIGALLAAPLPKIERVGARARATLSQLGAHLAAGYRVRRAFGTRSASTIDDQAEAVLLPSGRCEHAEPAAGGKATREALRDAARRIDRARGKLRRSDPEEALNFWRGLVAGRWSLVDRFDTDGRRFVVALRNDPQLPDPRALSLGERQVLGYAMLGHSLKLTGYELGIAPSTVSERLTRAMKKLGARSRAELVSLLDPARAPARMGD